MDDLLADLRAQQAELAAIVDPLTEDELRLPSRCPGWSVADVLLHLAQTDEMAAASVDGRVEAFMADAAERMAAAGLADAADVDGWAGALVELERGAPDAARARWHAAAAAELAAFERVDPGARLTWVAGELAARTLATTRLTETWIHTVDAAVAVGDPPAPTERLWHTARLAWRTLPYAVARVGTELHGSVAFELEAPDGSTWRFGPGGDGAAATIVRGSALELCEVAAQRRPADDTALVASGPDGQLVLRLVRTFA